MQVKMGGWIKYILVHYEILFSYDRIVDEYICSKNYSTKLPFRFETLHLRRLEGSESKRWCLLIADCQNMIMCKSFSRFQFCEFGRIVYKWLVKGKIWSKSVKIYQYLQFWSKSAGLCDRQGHHNGAEI